MDKIAAAGAADHRSARVQCSAGSPRADPSSHASTLGTSTSTPYLNGHARVLKRSASPEADFSEHNSHKRAREDNNAAFKRILTHTFHLQPFRATNSKKEFNSDIYPDRIQADLSSFPVLKHNGVELAYLASTTSSHGRGTVPGVESRYLISCLAFLLSNTSILRVEGGMLQKTPGKAPNSGRKIPSKHASLDFHYTLEMDIHLNLSELGHLDTDDLKKGVARLVPVAVEGLLRQAFLKDRHVDETVNAAEIRSNTRFKEVNLEWFYACLPRPPVAGTYGRIPEDRKGKGKARETEPSIDETTGSRSIAPPGLMPSL